MVIDPLAVPWEGLTVTLEIPSLALYRCRVALRGGLTGRPPPLSRRVTGDDILLTDHPPCRTTPLTLSHSPPDPTTDYHPGAHTGSCPDIPVSHNHPSITTPAPSRRTTPNHAVTHRIICCRAILQPGSDQNVFQSQPASPPEPIQFPPARRALLLLQPAALAGDSPPLSRSQIDTFLDIFFNRYPINRATSGLD